MQTYHHSQPLQLECGSVLNQLHVGYHTHGKLNNERDNVIWICHALTGDTNVAGWWPGLIGKEAPFDTDKYFIVCANMLGSCYGTTGPLSIDTATGQPYHHSFPPVTIRDMVAVHALLATHLGIKKIHLLAGGSMGGYLAIEWCVMHPRFINRLFLIATSAQESAWGIAIHTAQRMAIEADVTWNNNTGDAGKQGLKAARAIGMITYRSYKTYAVTQKDSDPEKLDDFKATSYIKYQGDKLANRFNAYSYWLLTKALDSHNLARGRNAPVESVLQTIIQNTLIIGITSDLLCPVEEQEMMAKNIPNNVFRKIDSLYGHDGFLVETAAITRHLNGWLSKEPTGERSENDILH